MKARTLALACSPLLAGILLLSAIPANGQEAEKKADDAEVLTRGPVHEAYADPGVTPTEAPPIVEKQPPDPINELPPDQKPEGENVQWVPGYWSWDEDRNDFIWLSGFWRVPPADRTWMPGSWRQVEDGWQWTPGFWQAAAQEQMDFLPPPPAPLEAAPPVPAPAADSIYAPGTWVYRDSRFWWRPGSWLAYRPGWIWVPAHYVWTPAGYVFVEGYWDYPLRNRGLLFAPVYFTNRVWLRPGWFYTPTYGIYDTFLTGSLFVRVRWGGYYFGDYFGDLYGRRGFVSWIDIRFGRGVYDPMFSFYLRFHSGDRAWERDLRALYAARQQGDFLPPRTLAQQNTLIQNITNNKTVNVTNIKNVTAVAPLAKLDPTVVKLQPVTADQRARERQTIERVRDAAVRRQKLETQLLAKGPPPTKPTDSPRTVKLDATITTTRPVTTVKPPPAPHTATKLVDRPLTVPSTGKTTDTTSGKTGTGTPTGVTPKKDTPTTPMPKKDAPPATPKRDTPAPMPKRDNPAPKKDAPPPMQKKDKDKKQAAVTVPSSKPAVNPAPVAQAAAPRRTEVKASAAPRPASHASSAPSTSAKPDSSSSGHTARRNAAGKTKG
jgi:hypothetical protein